MQRSQQIIDYIDKQFSELCDGINNGKFYFPFFTKVKFQNENGQTNYMNLTNDQMNKIMQVLKESDNA